MVHEAFADRAYTPEGTLVSRRLPGAVLHDPTEIAPAAWPWPPVSPIEDVEGGSLTLSPHSICVHGDTPGAVEIARQVRSALDRGRGRPSRPSLREARAPQRQRRRCSSSSTTWTRSSASTPPWSTRTSRGGRPRPGGAHRAGGHRPGRHLGPRDRERRTGTPTRSPRLVEGELVELPVVYDGEDLAEVAELLDCDVDEVVRRHTAQAWTVAFCGFAPGFGYLTSDSWEWDLPRRSSPRTKVPRGAVALAGPVLRRLPARVTGRLAAHRPDRGAGVRPRPRARGAAAPRRPGPLRRGRVVTRRLTVLESGPAHDGAGRRPRRPGGARHRPVRRLRPRVVPARQPAGRQRARCRGRSR